MYLLFLFLLAFFLISIFSTNWPVKLYHHYLLVKLADAMGVGIEKNSLFSNVYSQISTFYEGRNITIRFVDGSIDSIKANQGLEIRVQRPSQLLMEFYRFRQNKREWGDFKHFITGEKMIDAEWFILTDNLEIAADFWRAKSVLIQKLLNEHVFINQILINKKEIIVQLRRFHSCERIISLINQIIETFE